jgi:hypothetical protein
MKIGEKIWTVAALLGIVACFYLALCGISLHQEEQEAKNKIRWEATR